jgi:hypothetical protein
MRPGRPGVKTLLSSATGVPSGSARTGTEMACSVTDSDGGPVGSAACATPGADAHATAVSSAAHTATAGPRRPGAGMSEPNSGGPVGPGSSSWERMPR